MYLLRLAFLFIVLSCTACSHYYYAPDDSVGLVIEDKSDLKAAAGIFSFSDRALGGNMQIGYSPIRYLSIQGNYMRKSTTVDRDRDENSQSDGQIGTVAIGTYLPINKRKYESRSMLLDLYIGYSLGEVDNLYFNGSNSFFALNRRFVQGGLHWSDNLIGIDLTTKFGTLDYTTARIEGPAPFAYVENLQKLQRKDIYTFLENTLRMRYSLQKMDLFFSANYFLDTQAGQGNDFRDRNSFKSPFMKFSRGVFREVCQTKSS